MTSLNDYIEKAKRLMDRVEWEQKLTTETSMECYQTLKNLLEKQVGEKQYVKIEKDVYDIVLLNSTKYLAIKEDEYFQGLDIEAILELAKKSIRITSENIEMHYTIEGLESELKEVVNVLRKASPKHYEWPEVNFKKYLNKGE